MNRFSNAFRLAFNIPVSKFKHSQLLPLFCVRNMETDTMKPVDVRRKIRSGDWKRLHTSGSCRGYKQANMAMVHRDVAEDFKAFCKMNVGPLPLIYVSKPGEVNSPIAEDSDVRTDVPGYKIFHDGEFVKVTDDLLDYDWKDMVSFYFGCSFSFEEAMMKNNVVVRNVAQNKKNVPMFKTTIPCHAVGKFACSMIVSMRPIPENQLSLVSDITSQMEDIHGAPVHIGNPDIILPKGASISSPDYGENSEILSGDVPVFWACGVTNGEAIKAARPPLAMTHHPGMMFISDVEQEPYNPSLPDSDKCSVIKYSAKGQRYALLSMEAKQVLSRLEDAVGDDPGNRGVPHLQILGDFMNSALALSHASSVAITTGFPCLTGYDPPDETDGLPGVYSLVGMLQAQKKKVTLIVDRRAREMNRKIMEKQLNAGVIREEIAIVPYINDKGECHGLIGENGEPKYDVMLATERSGRASDGRYYSMKKNDISEGIDPIDDLFQEATENEKVVTIGVGDGGNELGMGKVLESVKKNVMHGETIACKVSADNVVAAGTSNWGCYGLSFALHALRRCWIHDRYYRRATGPGTDSGKEFGWALPTVEREEKNLEIVESEGIRDGIKPHQKMSVDGFSFHPVHSNKIVEMRKILGI